MSVLGEKKQIGNNFGKKKKPLTKLKGLFGCLRKCSQRLRLLILLFKVAAQPIYFLFWFFIMIEITVEQKTPTNKS